MHWTQAVFFVVGIAVVIVFLYAVVPNVVTRILRLYAVRKGPSEPVVALTFDDGPDPKYTPQLIDALNDAGVRATFFVIAEKALQRPELIERMVSAGHDVQVHGDRHLFVPWLAPSLALHQVEGASQKLETAFGLRTSFYRPTWGLCNLVSMLPRVRRRFRLVTWSIMVGDWRVTPAAELLERISTRLHPGAIIVLHDSDETVGAHPGAPENVVQLIPDLVQLIHYRGYSFKTIAEWI